MKIRVYLLYSSIFITLLASSCIWGEIPFTEISTPIASTSLSSNIIALWGEDLDSNSIEIKYMEYDSLSHTNIMISKKVTPPCLLGEHTILVDRIEWRNNKNNSKDTSLVVDYNEGGSAYLEILNHSSKSIEYGIIGNQETVLSTFKGNCKEGIWTHPRVVFNDLPLLYWLYPDKNKIWGTYIISDKRGVSYCESPKTTWSKNFQPLTIEDIIKIYRAEYNNSPDTVLYVNLRDQFNSSFAFTQDKTRLHKIPLTDGTSRIQNVVHYYGKIKPQESFKANQYVPTIAVPLEDDCTSYGTKWLFSYFNNQYHYFFTQ